MCVRDKWEGCGPFHGGPGRSRFGLFYLIYLFQLCIIYDIHYITIVLSNYVCEYVDVPDLSYRFPIIIDIYSIEMCRFPHPVFLILHSRIKNTVTKVFRPFSRPFPTAFIPRSGSFNSRHCLSTNAIPDHIVHRVWREVSLYRHFISWFPEHPINPCKDKKTKSQPVRLAYE
jgi:hypothetical protein